MAGRRPKRTPSPGSPDATDVVGDGAVKTRAFVVGIGASAGGFEGFKKFFHAMPSDRGLSFSIVQHHSPHAASLLAEILSQHTAMTVREATSPVQVEPNRVYVAPPGGYLVLQDDVLTPILPGQT